MTRDSDTRPLQAGPSRPIGNVVLKVEAYDGDAVGENCHPGVISGTVMGGQLDGRRIDAWTRITPTNSMVPTVADLQDESKMVRTPPGGYLALENVRFEAGRYTAQWINRMGDPGATLRAGIPMQVSPSIGADGNVRRFRSNGATIYNGFLMNMGSAEQTPDFGTMRQTLAEAMNGGRGRGAGSGAKDGSRCEQEDTFRPSRLERRSSCRHRRLGAAVSSRQIPNRGSGRSTTPEAPSMSFRWRW